MGIIGWVVPGPAAGGLANMLIPGKRSPGVAITYAIGVAGAPDGGWAATRPSHLHSVHEVFNSTWLTAIAGATVLLLASHPVTGRACGRVAPR